MQEIGLKIRLIKISEMVKRERYNLSLSDDVLNVNQTDFGAEAVKRNLSVVAHYENLTLGNNARNRVVSVIAREGSSLYVGL